MKKLHQFFVLAFASLFLVVTSCQKEDVPPPQQSDILPARFSVDVTRSLNYNASTLKSAEVDTLPGNEIYGHLGTFICVGETGSKIVEEVINAIRVYNINKPMSFSFTSDEDGRVKNAVVVARADYDNRHWEFGMTITDAESEGNADGGKALQLFWNRSPIKGIAIMKPYNINRTENEDDPDAMYRIDYSEAGEHGYRAEMTVYAAYLPVADPLDNPWSMSSLKMFVGVKGDIVDVYGNSVHPNAILLAGNTGFTYSFVASGDNSTDLGVAEVGLPPVNLDEPSRNILLGYYSLKKVITREIYEVWPDIDPESVQAYLYNASAPGFFDANGFVAGGTAPGTGYEQLVRRLPYLSPYNPKEVLNLSIVFKD